MYACINISAQICDEIITWPFFSVIITCFTVLKTNLIFVSLECQPLTGGGTPKEEAFLLMDSSPKFPRDSGEFQSGGRALLLTMKYA